ncbi:hypothetical protein D3C80_537310 [compost metagenome]
MNANPVAKDLGDALDNRQPQAHALAVGGAADVQLVELEEDRIEPVGGDATPGVPDLQAQHLAPTPHRQQDAAFIGVAAGIAEEVAQDPRHQAQVGADGVIGHAHPQVQAGRLGDGLELRHQRPKQFVEAVRRDVRLDRGLIEPGNVEQIRQQVFGPFQGLVSAFHQHLLSLRQLAFAQGRNQQPRGVQRLQQVVAGGGEVFVLAVIGGLGGIAGIAQGLGDLFTLGDLLLKVTVGFEQFIGARDDALLQFVIELLQASLGQLALGDIGDEPFHQAFLAGLEQQVHQHIQVTAILAPQAGFIAVQAALVPEDFADGFQFLRAVDEQGAAQVSQGEQHLLRVLVAEHVCQRRVGGAHAIVQAGLEDPVHRVFEQPLVAVTLGFQIIQARGQFRVMTLARRMAAQPQQPGQGALLLVRGLRHRRPRHHAGWIRAGWSGCTDHASHAATGTECPRS